MLACLEREGELTELVALAVVGRHQDVDALARALDQTEVRAKVRVLRNLLHHQQ